jgi:hypothetical protein
VDENGKSNFLNAAEKIIYKSGILKGFNFYWNSGDPKESLIVEQKNYKNDDVWTVNITVLIHIYKYASFNQ